MEYKGGEGRGREGRGKGEGRVGMKGLYRREGKGNERRRKNL